MKEDTNNYTTTNREGQTVTYSVPVIRHRWKEQKRDASQILVEKIRATKTVAEANALVEKAITSNPKAAQSMVDRWKRTAERRVRTLS
jgi:hypothetical protein